MTDLAKYHEKISPRPHIAERVLDCFPSGAYALSALLRLLDIVESREVPTAAVECRAQPRLLVNPDFVDRHAETPEKLLMLVMHELHHVLLGHTKLFEAITPVQNFVFDAVINGLICRMFPATAHTAFFSDFYDAASFPHCLLRPPPGWPARFTTVRGITALRPKLAGEAATLHRALYSAGGATYLEVYDVLPKLLGDTGTGDVPLLGGHGAGGAMAGDLESKSPLLFDIVRGIVEQWPQPPDPICGRSLASMLQDETVLPRRTRSSRQVLRALIRRVANLGTGGSRRLRSEAPCMALVPFPTMSRRSAVLRQFGHAPLLHEGSVPFHRRQPAGERVHVYLDVSGSMNTIKDALYGAVLDCRGDVHPAVHLFSTKVAEVSLAERARGVCRSTGGTDIVCVAKHIAANHIRRALIVTDGYVGKPRGHHHDILSGAHIAVAYLGSNVNTSDLAGIANATDSLPI